MSLGMSWACAAGAHAMSAMTSENSAAYNLRKTDKTRPFSGRRRANRRKGENMGMQRTRRFYIGAVFITLFVALGTGQAWLQSRADAQGRTVQAPMFEVDPLWPKPLPNH